MRSADSVSSVLNSLAKPQPQPLPQSLAPSPQPLAPAADQPPLVSALSRYRPPVPARVAVDAAGRPVRVTTDRRNLAGGTVRRCAGPWRTSGEWWESGITTGQEGQERQNRGTKACVQRRSADASTGAEAWDRDEWDVALGDEGMYRVFRDRVTEAWFIEAVVD